jgi:hypothetical protein
MTGAGFPQKREQFKTFRDVTSNTQTKVADTPTPDRIGAATPDRTMYADAFLMILSNKNNPIVEILFEDVFPISLGDLEYNQGATDVEYMSATSEFAYKIYTITTL